MSYKSALKEDRMFVRKDNVGRVIGKVGARFNYGGIRAGGPPKKK